MTEHPYDHCVHGRRLDDEPCEECEVFLAQIESWMDLRHIEIVTDSVPVLLEAASNEIQESEVA